MNYDQSFWTAVAAIAQTAAAIGTFAAVAFAMWQWSHQWKPRLRVRVDRTITANPIVGNQTWITVDVVNMGVIPVRLASIEYRPSRWRPMRWFHPYDHTVPFGSKLPLKLDQAESATYFWTVQDWETAMSGALRESLAQDRWLKFFWKRDLRVSVRSSTGQAYFARVPRSLIKRLEALIGS